MPDVVARKNFKGDWGTWSIAGFGITPGGKLILGKKGDDIRIIATYGNGVARYVSAGFSPGAVIDQNNELQAIKTLNGYIALGTRIRL